MQPTEKEDSSIFRWKQNKTKQKEKRPRQYFVLDFPSFCFAFSAVTEAEESRHELMEAGVWEQ